LFYDDSYCTGTVLHTLLTTFGVPVASTVFDLPWFIFPPFLPFQQSFCKCPEVEESVDLAAQLQSSVAIGKTPFAKMHGDLDRHRSGSQKYNHTSDDLSSELQRKKS
ncbi:hypothetical protein CEXT_632041, partial [Caerostris extrusa]